MGKKGQTFKIRFRKGESIEQGRSPADNMAQRTKGQNVVSLLV